MSFRVRLDSGEGFEVEAAQTLLGAALRAGIPLPSDCRQGACGTCRVEILEGRVTYDEPPMGLAPEDEAAGYAFACQARAQSDLVIRAASAALVPAERRTAAIAAIERLTPDVFHLRLELERAIDYAPGQHMKVVLPGGATRNFSMASRPNGGALDFHVRRVPGGRFTDGQLPGMRPGQPVEVELPHGAFIFRRQDYRPVLMVATGTGLAPLRSMLHALLDDPDAPPIELYWGMRTACELYADAELRAWAQRIPGLRYVPVLSRADASWTGRRGHVHDAVCEDHAKLSELAIYLCGSPNMIGEAKPAFARRGASLEHLYADGFVFQGRGNS